MKKIAIELFGQLRMWDEQKSLEDLENFLNKEGFSVDYFGTFWDDKYTKTYVNKGAFKNFKSLQLIEEPIITDEVERRNPTLRKYFHSLKKSVKQRKRYQTEHNSKYEFIIQSRPDIKYYFHPDSSKFLKELVELLDKIDEPCVFLDKKWDMKLKPEDKFIISNELGANSLSNAIDKLSTFTYHTSLYEAINLLVGNFLEIKMFFRYYLIRHDVISEYNFDDFFTHDSVISSTNPQGFVRNYLKTIQDTTILTKEIERLQNIHREVV